MAYYFKCPFFNAERYPTAQTEQQKNRLAPHKGQVLVECECAKILCANIEAKQWLFKNYCASNDWEKCTVAIATMKKYDNEGEQNEKEN